MKKYTTPSVNFMVLETQEVMVFTSANGLPEEVNFGEWINGQSATE